MKLLWSEVVAVAGFVAMLIPSEMSDRIGAVFVAAIVFAGVRIAEREFEVVPWDER